MITETGWFLLAISVRVLFPIGILSGYHFPWNSISSEFPCAVRYIWKSLSMDIT